MEIFSRYFYKFHYAHSEKTSYVTVNFYSMILIEYYYFVKILRLRKFKVQNPIKMVFPKFFSRFAKTFTVKAQEEAEEEDIIDPQETLRVCFSIQPNLEMV